MGITDFTATDLQDDILGPNDIEESRGKESKRMKTENYMRSLAIYNFSIFQEFESFLRTEID